MPEQPAPVPPFPNLPANGICARCARFHPTIRLDPILGVDLCSPCWFGLNPDRYLKPEDRR
jgi:hypothetical protein